MVTVLRAGQRSHLGSAVERGAQPDAAGPRAVLLQELGRGPDLSAVPGEPGDRPVRGGIATGRHHRRGRRLQLDASGARLGEEPVLARVREQRAAPPQGIVDDVFTMVNAFVGQTPLLDDLTLVVLRT